MIKINKTILNIEHFPAGEQRLNFKTETGTDYLIEWVYEREDELLTLIYLCRHIKSRGGILNELYIPYLPNARMDRVMNKSEVFTLKYFCELINSLEFSKIYINNPHSDVCMGLINNSENAYLVNGKVYHNNDIILYLIKKLDLDSQKDILFYPDNGCAKKYEGVIRFPYLTGQKHREWNTGKITGLEIAGTIPGHSFNVLIVDDISSYGGTFLHSARKLKENGAEKIYLYITHCENTILEGDLINSGLLEKIYTTRSIFTAQCPPIIEILENMEPEDMEHE